MKTFSKTLIIIALLGVICSNNLKPGFFSSPCLLCEDDYADYTTPNPFDDTWNLTI